MFFDLFQGRVTDTQSYPSLATIHAICAIGLLQGPATTDASRDRASRARIALDLALDRGPPSQDLDHIIGESSRA